MSIYRSNLSPPAGILDRFKHLHRRVEPWSYGHDVISDFADKGDDPRFFNHRNCTFMTEDEQAILYNTALQLKPGVFLDIGGHTGFSGLTIAAAGHTVTSIDPEYGWNEFWNRWHENVGQTPGIWSWTGTSNEFFEPWEDWFETFTGALIDGNHDAPCPLEDAMNCAMYAAETCALVLHDTYGGPIQEALLWLHAGGWKIRWYDTPNGMAVAWRGDFEPPDHTPDPRIDWAGVRRDRGAALIGKTV